jgi:DNA-binding LytR/AlgR family response regulator
MINCIIIEDQLPAQRILKKYIEDVDSLHLAGVYSNAILALDSLKFSEIDLIFLDIHLPKISGIDFLKSISNPPKIILTTAFSDYALESYELAVADYLLKPFSFQRFVKAVSKVTDTTITKNKNNSNSYIFIKSGYEHFKINIDSILFINSDENYTDIYLKDKKYISSESLKYWEEKLNNFGFLRVQKSFILNTQKIIKTSSSFIYLENNHKIPLGRAYKDTVLDQLTK